MNAFSKSDATCRSGRLWRGDVVGAVAGKGPRICLYSHDTMGLGHTRRNLLIARALAAPPLSATVLMITGIRQSGAFAAPDGVDFLTLPAYAKNQDGSYQSRSLGIDGTALSALRGEVIKAGIEGFRPDLFVVDNVPLGALNELVPALEYMARSGSTRCVLGLRDIIDEPASVRRQWIERSNFKAIRDFYDAVWIYGDPSVYDAMSEYGFPSEIGVKTRYTGYLNPATSLSNPQPSQSLRDRGDFVLCLAGGGQDGLRLLSEFAKVKLPSGARGLMVTGPFMRESDRQELRHSVAGAGRISVRDFVTDPLPLIRGAKAVIAMGGYNTVMELLSLEKQALVVPRTKPRMEQFIRAQRLKSLGVMDFVREEDLTSGGISEWLRNAPPRRSAMELIDFGGLERLTCFAAEMIGSRPAPFDLSNSAAQEALHDAV